MPRLATPLIVLPVKVRTSLVDPAEITALLVTPVLIHSPPTKADAVKRGWLVKDALKRALSAARGTVLGFQLLLVAQSVLLAPVHDLSVANADWLVRSAASMMVWMAIRYALRGDRRDERCELIVEQNFIGGCVLVDYFLEPVPQFTDILRKLRREVLEKVMRLRSGGIGLYAGLCFRH